MRIGDLVRIVNANHPWAGTTGEIVDRVHDQLVLAGRRWTVKLDATGYEIRAGDQDLEAITRPGAQLNLEGDIVTRGP